MRVAASRSPKSIAWNGRRGRNERGLSRSEKFPKWRCRRCEIWVGEWLAASVAGSWLGETANYNSYLWAEPASSNENGYQLSARPTHTNCGGGVVVWKHATTHS